MKPDLPAYPQKPFVQGLDKRNLLKDADGQEAAGEASG
jgi:hypothetical protein